MVAAPLDPGLRPGILRRPSAVLYRTALRSGPALRVSARAACLIQGLVMPKSGSGQRRRGVARVMAHGPTG